MLLLPLHKVVAERQLERAGDESRVKGWRWVRSGKSDLEALGTSAQFRTKTACVVLLGWREVLAVALVELLRKRAH